MHEKARQLGKECKLAGESLKKETQPEQIVSSTVKILEEVREMMTGLWETTE